MELTILLRATEVMIKDDFKLSNKELRTPQKVTVFRECLLIEIQESYMR